MISKQFPSALTRGLVLVLLASRVASAQDASKGGSPQATFDAMLKAAKANPANTDWKALRLAFAQTPQYDPYNAKWRTEIEDVRTQIAKEDYKGAAAALEKLNERERFMRVDAHMLSMMVYEELKQKDKQTLHENFVAGILGVLMVPGTGTSYQKPIDVLFIEEEDIYLNMISVKRKRDGLQIHDGHRFDVYTIDLKPGQGQARLYFNIDLPQKALERDLKATKKAASRG